MELSDLRVEIDQADKELLAAFEKRMEISVEIAKAKEKIGKATYDAKREREKMASVYDMASDDVKPYVLPLYSLIMELSRARQTRVRGTYDEKYGQIEKIIAEYTGKTFPQRAIVACQGVEGAFSQSACEKMFDIPSIMFVNSFNKVFSAIETGLCQYGVIPVENSTAGTVSNVYDLMIQHKFKIVRSVRVKVSHNLLMNQGASISDIKEVISHQQAIDQSREYIRTLGPDVKVTYAANTAVAAKMVAESGRKDIAAISSISCADLYNLQAVAKDIQDRDNNYTRFICISKNTEIYPGSDKTSFMMVLNHKPGALYKVLALLYSRGINVVKLESRPLPGREFEFMFYFDLAGSVYSADFIQVLSELDNMSLEFRYLGSYSEIV